MRRGFTLLPPLIVIANGFSAPGSFGFGRAFNACSASRWSSFVVILMLIGEPGTTVTRMPDPLDQLGVVGGVETGPLRVGVQQQLPAEDLRRLGFPKILRAKRFPRSCGRRRPV